MSENQQKVISLEEAVNAVVSQANVASQNAQQVTARAQEMSFAAQITQVLWKRNQELEALCAKHGISTATTPPPPPPDNVVPMKEEAVQEAPVQEPPAQG
jgi:hypothetical protein